MQQTNNIIMPISRGRGQYTYMIWWSMINLLFKSPTTIAQSTVAIAAPPSTSIVWNDKNTIMMIYFLRHGPVGGIMVECVTSVWPPDVDADNVTWIMRRWGSCYSIIPLIPGTFISVTLFAALRLLGCDCCGLSECIQFKSPISLFPMSANLISILQCVSIFGLLWILAINTFPLL